MDVDRVDLRIIGQLEKDGRASLREIAEKLDMSPSTVSNRFRQLKEEGVIKGFKPVLDYEKLGFGLTAVIEVKVKAGMRDLVVPQVKKSNVTTSYVLTGETDIVLVCKFIDREDMYDFLRVLQDEDGVKDTVTNVVLHTSRENGDVALERLKDEI